MSNARRSPFFLSALALGLLVLLRVTPAVAQSGDPGVAFVSTLNGDVSVQRGDSGDVVTAGVNAPLLVGDSVWTAPGARAEVQFDYGHIVRLGPNTEMRFAELGRSDDTVQLASGSVGVSVLHATSQYTQVETPSATIRPREAGFYRITVDAKGKTAVTVRSGNAAILLPQGTRWLDPGSTMEIWGPADRPSYRYVGTVGRDGFEQWNGDRDAAFARSRSYQYAPSGIPGLYALDAYGQWANDPDYGDEWIPNEAATWSPYSSGQWAAEPYYGWTWVDNAPWGYAPSHYGRWHRDQRRNRWAWTPGGRTQPVQPWAPALVAFIGFGGGGLTIALIDSIAWVPLAPNEQPHRWWGDGARNYVAVNPGNVRTVYRNAQYTSAVRSLPRTTFGAGGYARTNAVPPANLAHAIVMRGAIPVVPAPQAQRFTQRTAPPPRPRAAEPFHAFATAPHARQTFVQQRAQATAVVQQHAVVQPQRQAPVGAPPVRQAPAFRQPQQPVAPAVPPPQRQAPVAAPPVRQPPAFRQPQQPVAPAVKPPQRPAPPAVQAPHSAPAPPVRQPPAVKQPQERHPPAAAAAQPVRPAPVFAAPQRQAPAARPAPAVPPKPAETARQDRGNAGEPHKAGP